MSGGFQVPFSSSPPSTPPGSHQGGGGTGFSFASGLASNPSTTPAGPPPSSARSFTPAGPPPSMLIESSLPRGQSLFEPSKQGKLGVEPTLLKSPGKKSPKKTNPLFAAHNEQFGTHPNGQATLASAHSSPGRRSEGGESLCDEEEDEDYEPGETEDSEDDEEYEDDEDEDEYDEEDGEGDDDEEDTEGDMEVDLEQEDATGQSLPQPQHQSFNSSVPYDWGAHGVSVQSQGSSVQESATPRGMKRSRAGVEISRSALHTTGDQLLANSESAIPAICKDIAKQLGTAELDEPDDLIIETEKYISKLYPEENNMQDPEDLMEAALQVVPEALGRVWQNCCNKTKKYRSMDQEFTLGVGPRDDERSFHKAAFIGTLLLRLHHPPVAKGTQAYAPFKTSRPSQSAFRPVEISRAEAYPKVLLDWLEESHNPYQNALAGLNSHQPNPTAHANFWDILFSATLRGKLHDVVRILSSADFSVARTAKEDGQSREGYTGAQLSAISRVVRQGTELLNSCPGAKDGDWNVSGSEWDLFRRRVEKTISDLSSFAEGRDRDRDPVSSSFEASNFGLKSASNELSRSARRAESKVPWTIYQNLKVIYGLLLGSTAELISAAQNWLEATIALTLWWDGDDDDGLATKASTLSRSNLGRSHAQFNRLVDVNPGAAYRRRLGAAFDRVTNNSAEDALQIDSNNTIELAIASIFESNVEGVLGLLRGWSVPIACAVVEIASQAGWYESAPGDGEAIEFDESDLMVLSYGQPEKTLSKDNLLSRYATMLFDRDRLEHSQTHANKEGWEFSIEVLSRLDDTTSSNRKIGDILSRIPVESDERADKLISLCRSFDLGREACGIAEKYANLIAETSDRYGTALIYYARSHNVKKVTDVLDLLISFCLVQSISFPPVASLDAHLSSLLLKPRDSLTCISEIDPEASEILSTHMSGYATLRKFYDLRDEEVNNRPTLRPAARKKAAAASLLAVVASSADNIQGGLYDENSSAVVPVDGLLVLLGEASVLVDQPTRILSLQQILVLLRAIEDLQTIHPRIRSQCLECLSSTLASGHGTASQPDIRDMMKKSISELTASSGFSLVGSSIVGSGRGRGRGSDGMSRGWDWRVGMKPGDGIGQIIPMLRIGLARDVSRAWMDGEEM